MITLNSDRGLQRIESWDDITGTSGFTPHVNPRAVKLKEIVGSYTFGTMVPCGLSTCQQPHANGFLVVLEDGRLTNIGRVCGKRYFSVEFTQMSRIFLAAVRAQQNREFLGTLKNRLPGITAEIAALKAGEYGAAWINTRVNHLAGRSGSLPSAIVNAVRQVVRRGDGALVIQRAATKEEREALSTASEVTGLERRNHISSFVEDRIGQLDGFAALAPGNGLRDILLVIESFLTTLSEVEIDNLPDKQLRELSRVGGELEPNLERLRTVVAAGRRLLVRQNIQQLSRFATSRGDAKLFNLFLRELPQQET